MSKNSTVCEPVSSDKTAFYDPDDSALNDPAENNRPLRDKDGVYHWICELPMMNSFFLLFEVWRVLFLSAGIIIVIMAVINLCSGQGLDGVIGAIGIGLLVLAILMVLSLPAYWIVTKANNGKYTVLFEMNEEGIDHTQIKTEKAQALEILTMFVGSKTGNRTVTGSGLLSAAGTSLYSRFSDVRKITADASKCLIQLKSRLIRNQVYTDPEHYDFVLDYITSHCPQAEIIKK